MRRLKLIGIGAGNPDYITVQAINALQQVDVIFVIDKGEDTADLVSARKSVCDRYMQARPHRIIEIRDPERDRMPAEYRTAVAAWHEKRTVLYEQAIRDELSEEECAAFLVWGDPSLYDSTLRIIDQVAARRSVAFEWEIIPGITSVQALAARHRISLNEIGGSIHITTGRRLIDEHPAAGADRTADRANVLVLLDGNCAFKALEDADMDIYWGAYLGTPDEILLSGKLSELSEQIVQVRAHARNQKGWIMDTYLLRKRGTSSC
jgi:precorrin-6A synthase